MSFNILRISGAIINAAADVVNAASSAIDTKSTYMCPKCGVRLQRVGLPSHLRHATLGGTRCWNCSCQVTSSGEMFNGDYVAEAKIFAEDMAKEVSKDAAWVASKINNTINKK